MYVKPGSTSVSLILYIQDAASGGAYVTEDQSDWTFNYVRDGDSSATADATITAGTLGTWGEGTSKPFGTTGLWQIDFADAAFASAANRVTLLVTHDNGDFIPVEVNVDLSDRESDLVKIHGTALTETSGRLAAAFKNFFNIATPTGTINSLPAAIPGATGGLPVRGGAIPDADADAAGGLPISDAGGLDMDALVTVLNYAVYIDSWTVE